MQRWQHLWLVSIPHPLHILQKSVRCPGWYYLKGKFLVRMSGFHCGFRELYPFFRLQPATCESSDNVVQNGFEVKQLELKGYCRGKWKGVVRWRHTHVGAPENRIIRFPMEHVLTPQGNDMIPVFGPVVTISPRINLPHSQIYNNSLEIIFQFFFTLEQ